jgi:hypothetical protein
MARQVVHMRRWVLKIEDPQAGIPAGVIRKALKTPLDTLWSASVIRELPVLFCPIFSSAPAHETGFLHPRDKAFTSRK